MMYTALNASFPDEYSCIYDSSTFKITISNKNNTSFQLSFGQSELFEIIGFEQKVYNGIIIQGVNSVDVNGGNNYIFVKLNGLNNFIYKHSDENHSVENCFIIPITCDNGAQLIYKNDNNQNICEIQLNTAPYRSSKLDITLFDSHKRILDLNNSNIVLIFSYK